MKYHSINKETSEFAHKNLSLAKNSFFSITMILLVILCAAQGAKSINSTAKSPNADTVFYRIDSSIRRMQDQLWKQGLDFLRRKKKKLRKIKCYITVDETYDSYTGKLHKKPITKLTKEQKTTRKYIHKYKIKRGDTGSFKYLVFALVYGNKKQVLCVKPLKRKEEYWSFVSETLKTLYNEVKFECALLDRGFYVAELVDELEKEKIPYLIRAKLCDTFRKVYGIFQTWRSYDYEVAEWAKTTLVLGKDFKGRDWGFITNLKVKNLENLRQIYKKRWNIENIFKATDGIQVQVATANHKTRLFAVCLSFLIYNNWQCRNKRPTLLNHVKQSIKKILKWLFRSPYRDRFILNDPLWEFVGN
jgi:hypothetical protein